MRAPTAGRPSASSAAAALLPEVPATLTASDDAARVYHDVEGWLRSATDEPRRNADPDAWQTWSTTYLDAIHDRADAAATGRRS